MPKRSGKNDVDAEADYHGHTAEQMRLTLHRKLADWRGFRRVRVIHGQGEVLKFTLENWCREVGIPFEPEPNNPGSTLLFPAHRALPQPKLPNTLAASGLQMTPQQEAELRDPIAIEQERQRQKKLRAELERRRMANEAALRAQKQREEAMWQNEMARLDALDKSQAGNKRKDADAKPLPPIVLPPAVIKYEEGYWRSEIVRVGDTDTETLQKQKRTGLDKLAPPMETKPKTADAPNEAPQKKSAPKRDTANDAALFEAEMKRLMES